MYSLAFLRQHHLPDELIDYIESFFSESDRRKFNQHLSALLHTPSAANIMFLRTLKVRITQAEDKEKLNELFLDAVQKNRLHTARLLLSLGADIEAPQKLLSLQARLSPINWSPKRIEIFSPSSQPALEYKPLHIAICNGNLQMVQLCLAHHADVNATVFALLSITGSAYRETFIDIEPLAYADPDEFEKLKESPQYRECYKAGLVPYCLPLHLATKLNHTAIIQLLIEKGADVHAIYKDLTKPGYEKSSFSVIDLAAEHKNFEIVKLLLEKRCYYKVRGTFANSFAESDYFIAFVEQAIEREQRQEIRSQLRLLTNSIASIDKKIQHLSSAITSLAKQAKRSTESGEETLATQSMLAESDTTVRYSF